MNCLILGGAGFIGSHLTEALLQLGHRVRVFDRFDIDLSNLADVLPQIELFRGDFLNESDMSCALKDIDLVVHLISTTLPQGSNENPVFDVETNVVGSLRMLNLARKQGVRKIIFLSSGGTVYGHSAQCPILESDQTNPDCSYGICKLTIEKYLYLFNHLYDLDYVVLRVANPFGERQNPIRGQGVIVSFLWKFLKNEPITVWGDGSVTRDYFYVDDLVSAILAVVERNAPSKIYNIGSGVSHSLNELLSIMEKVTGRKPYVQYTSSRKLDVPINFLDISRARKELSWQPQISICEGISRTWVWLQNH